MALPSRLSILILAVAAALPLATSVPAHAQSAATVTAERFAVEPVRSLAPGTELNFQLEATPGAEVTLQIAGASGALRLDETRAGLYEGTWTVRSRDRLTAASLVTARVVKDGRSFLATLDQSLQRGAPSPVQAPRIGAFSVNAPQRIRAGDELKFSLSGVPGGSARAVVQGIEGDIALAEVGRGLYEGSHTLARKDRLRGDLVATGFLKVGQKEVSQRFTRQQAAVADAYGCDRNERYAQGDRRDTREARRADMTGATCGSVTAVTRTEIEDGDARNVIGTVAGGVLGAVLGNQVGGGSGRDIARIVGALGGAYAGNRVQNSQAKSTTVYRVAVQMDDGTTANFDHAVDPLLAVGARVKIVDGAIVRR
jgi:outer membrane lipoprotein SlyB